MSTNKFNIINAVRSEIVKYSSIENLKNFCVSHPEYVSPGPSCFTRERNFPFKDLLSFLLYPRSKSTDIELLEFSHLIGKTNVNKSDFSRRRRLIPACYLKAMNRDIISKFYSSSNEVIKWHGIYCWLETVRHTLYLILRRSRRCICRGARPAEENRLWPAELC